MATQFLLRPFVTVTIHDDGSATCEYDDVESLIMIKPDGSDDFVDYLGGAWWDEHADAYLRWTYERGLNTRPEEA